MRRDGVTPCSAYSAPGPIRTAALALICDVRRHPFSGPIRVYRGDGFSYGGRDRRVESTDQTESRRRRRRNCWSCTKTGLATRLRGHPIFLRSRGSRNDWLRHAPEHISQLIAVVCEPGSHVRLRRASDPRLRLSRSRSASCLSLLGRTLTHSRGKYRSMCCRSASRLRSSACSVRSDCCLRLSVSMAWRRTTSGSACARSHWGCTAGTFAAHAHT